MSYADEPKAPKPDPSTAAQEPTGLVASDSLAAESNKAGGVFSENDNVAVSSVKGANSTLANTDTSGATVLHAAVDGATREKQDAKGLGSDEKGSAGGLKYPDAEVPEFSGTHSQEGYVGGAAVDEAHVAAGQQSVAKSFAGATGDSFADGGAGVTGDSTASSADKKVTSSGGTSQGPAPGTGAAPVGASGDTDSADTAPNYAATVSGSIRSEGELKPKGKNLVEGDIPQTKTFTGNVGGDKDPGRLAEQKFEKIAAENAAGAPGGQKGDNENPFGALESERA